MFWSRTVNYRHSIHALVRVMRYLSEGAQRLRLQDVTRKPANWCRGQLRKPELALPRPVYSPDHITPQRLPRRPICSRYAILFCSRVFCDLVSRYLSIKRCQCPFIRVSYQPVYLYNRNNCESSLAEICVTL